MCGQTLTGTLKVIKVLLNNHTLLVEKCPCWIDPKYGMNFFCQQYGMDLRHA